MLRTNIPTGKTHLQSIVFVFEKRQYSWQTEKREQQAPLSPGNSQTLLDGLNAPAPIGKWGLQPLLRHFCSRCSPIVPVLGVWLQTGFPAFLLQPSPHQQETYFELGRIELVTKLGNKAVPYRPEDTPWNHFPAARAAMTRSHSIALPLASTWLEPRAGELRWPQNGNDAKYPRVTKKISHDVSECIWELHPCISPRHMTHDCKKREASGLNQLEVWQSPSRLPRTSGRLAEWPTPRHPPHPPHDGVPSGWPNTIKHDAFLVWWTPSTKQCTHTHTL